MVDFVVVLDDDDLLICEFKLARYGREFLF